MVDYVHARMRTLHSSPAARPVGGTWEQLGGAPRGHLHPGECGQGLKVAFWVVASGYGGDEAYGSDDGLRRGVMASTGAQRDSFLPNWCHLGAKGLADDDQLPRRNPTTAKACGGALASSQPWRTRARRGLFSQPIRRRCVQGHGEARRCSLVKQESRRWLERPWHGGDMGARRLRMPWLWRQGAMGAPEGLRRSSLASRHSGECGYGKKGSLGDGKQSWRRRAHSGDGKLSAVCCRGPLTPMMARLGS